MGRARHPLPLVLRQCQDLVNRGGGGLASLGELRQRCLQHGRGTRQVRLHDPRGRLESLLGVGRHCGDRLDVLVAGLRRLDAEGGHLLIRLHLLQGLRDLFLHILELLVLVNKHLLAVDQLLAGGGGLLRLLQVALGGVDATLQLRHVSGGVRAFGLALLGREDLPHVEHRGGGLLLGRGRLLHGLLQSLRLHRGEVVRCEDRGCLGDDGHLLLHALDGVDHLGEEGGHLPLGGLLLEGCELLCGGLEARLVRRQLLRHARRELLDVVLGLHDLEAQEALRLVDNGLALGGGRLRVCEGLCGLLARKHLDAFQERHLGLLAGLQRVLRGVHLRGRVLQHLPSGQAVPLLLQGHEHTVDRLLEAHGLFLHLRQLVLHRAVCGRQLLGDGPEGVLDRGLSGLHDLLRRADLLLGHLPVLRRRGHHARLLHLQLGRGQLVRQGHELLAGSDALREVLLELPIRGQLLLRSSELLDHA
mmetsp:Transcript_54377/g.157204  ORF Transcript_54377/g.157204 Transcript_54377/m.157204 type:complete len:474 (+) Transcript_54377:3533-4954(+)